jgi:hypothetical protein
MITIRKKDVFGRRKELECSVQDDGTKVYGPEGATQLYFSATGEYRGALWRNKDQEAHRRAVTKGIPVVLKENGNPSGLVYALMQLPPPCGEVRREHLIVLGYINRILHEDTVKVQGLIDKFSSAMKAARRLNGIDGNKTESERFWEHVEELCRKYKRPPTKGEIVKAFYIGGASTVSKLAKKTGLYWLPDDPRPGRRGSI